MEDRSATLLAPSWRASLGELQVLLDSTRCMVQNKLYYNNLSSGHNRQTCPSKRMCKEYNIKHHILLHKRSETTMSSNKPIADSSTLITSQNKAPTPEAVIIPRTALATVAAGPYSQKARVQLDLGATITDATSTLAQALKSKPIPCHTDISGVGGDKTSHCHEALFCTLAWRRKHPSCGPHHGRISFSRLGVYQTNTFSQESAVADPEFDRSGRIDILLGFRARNE